MPLKCRAPKAASREPQSSRAPPGKQTEFGPRAGEERDVVIVCVTQSKPSLGAHVSNLRRVNVAITRARRHLIVTGGCDVLRGVHPWAEIAEHADANGGIRDGVEALRYLTG